MSGGKFRARRLQRDAATLTQCLWCFQRVIAEEVEMFNGRPSCAACRENQKPSEVRNVVE